MVRVSFEMNEVHGTVPSSVVSTCSGERQLAPTALSSSSVVVKCCPGRDWIPFHQSGAMTPGFVNGTRAKMMCFISGLTRLRSGYVFPVILFPIGQLNKEDAKAPGQGVATWWKEPGSLNYPQEPAFPL